MMNKFKIGDRVRTTVPSFSEAEPGPGTVIDISDIASSPWPVAVRMDRNSYVGLYAYDELEHVAFKIDNHPWPVDVRLDDELEHVEEYKHIDSLDEYQRRTQDTAVYPGQGSLGGAMYAAMALNEEAGEVAGKVAKFIRKSSGWDDLLAYSSDSVIYPYPEELVLAVSKELGDVLYQAARVAEEFGLNMSDVATENIERLADRKKRDVIIGEGDDR